MDTEEKSIITHYLDVAKFNPEKLAIELEKLSPKEIEAMILNTDWWLALANDCEKEREYQHLCNLLFQSRKRKLDSMFIYSVENMDKIRNLDKDFKKNSIRLKEEVVQVLIRLDKKRHHEYFTINGGVNVNSPCFEDLRCRCGPLHPKYEEEYNLCFEIKRAEFNEINRLPIFDTETNYADKINIGENEHFGCTFYHYYSKSYLSLSDMLAICNIHGYFNTHLLFDRGIPYSN